MAPAGFNCTPSDSESWSAVGVTLSPNVVSPMQAFTTLMRAAIDTAKTAAMIYQ